MVAAVFRVVERLEEGAEASHFYFLVCKNDMGKKPTVGRNNPFTLSTFLHTKKK
jgi:hypothetical protein